MHHSLNPFMLYLFLKSCFFSILSLYIFGFSYIAQEFSEYVHLGNDLLVFFYFTWVLLQGSIKSANCFFFIYFFLKQFLHFVFFGFFGDIVFLNKVHYFFLVVIKFLLACDQSRLTTNFLFLKLHDFFLKSVICKLHSKHFLLLVYEFVDFHL